MSLMSRMLANCRRARTLGLATFLTRSLQTRSNTWLGGVNTLATNVFISVWARLTLSLHTFLYVVGSESVKGGPVKRNTLYKHNTPT